MEIIKKDTGDLLATLVVKVEENDYIERVNEELKKLRKKVNLKGFRPGKVPVSVVKQMFGDEVKVEQINKLVDEEISKYLKENNIDIIGELLPNENSPKLDLKKDKDFEFNFDLAYYPEIDIDIEALEKEKIKILPTDEMVEKELKNIARHHGENVEIEEITDGDDITITVNLTEQDKEDGIKVEDGLILYKYLSEQAQKELKGKKVGDKVVLNLKEAMQNETDLAGLLRIDKEKLAEVNDNFELEITKIQQFKEAELTEEVLEKEFGEKITLDEAKEKIKKELEKILDEESKTVFKYELQKKIFDEAGKVQLPDEFIIRWQKQMYPEKSEEEIKKGLDELKKSLIYYKLLVKYSKDNNLEVQNNDLVDVSKDRIVETLKQYGLPTSYFTDEQLTEFARQELEKMDSATLNTTYFSALENKIFAELYEKTDFTSEMSFEDFKKYLDEKFKKEEENKEEKSEDKKEEVTEENKEENQDKE